MCHFNKGIGCRRTGYTPKLLTINGITNNIVHIFHYNWLENLRGYWRNRYWSNVSFYWHKRLGFWQWNYISWLPHIGKNSLAQRTIKNTREIKCYTVIASKLLIHYLQKLFGGNNILKQISKIIGEQHERCWWAQTRASKFHNPDLDTFIISNHITFVPNPESMLDTILYWWKVGTIDSNPVRNIGI